jgi:yecA family protein
MSPLPFTEAHAEVLINFFSAPQRPEGTMRYEEVAGFLFAMACVPEVIPPSEWLPVVFNGHEPNFADALLALLNRTIDEVNEKRPTFPPRLTPFAEPGANLGPDTPLARWAQGFADGYEWLEESWPEELPEEAGDHLDTVLMVLTFFASRDVAASYLEEMGPEGETPETMAEDMLRVLPEAMRDYAELAESFALTDEEVAEEGAVQEPVTADKIGRNDPCPCGSGMKYKKCCGKVSE